MWWQGGLLVLSTPDALTLDSPLVTVIVYSVTSTSLLLVITLDVFYESLK